jgi:hypothetical protein
MDASSPGWLEVTGVASASSVSAGSSHVLCLQVFCVVSVRSWPLVPRVGTSLLSTNAAMAPDALAPLRLTSPSLAEGRRRGGAGVSGARGAWGPAFPRLSAPSAHVAALAWRLPSCGPCGRGVCGVPVHWHDDTCLHVSGGARGPAATCGAALPQVHVTGRSRAVYQPRDGIIRALEPECSTSLPCGSRFGALCHVRSTALSETCVALLQIVCHRRLPNGVVIVLPASNSDATASNVHEGVSCRFVFPVHFRPLVTLRAAARLDE